MPDPRLSSLSSEGAGRLCDAWMFCEGRRGAGGFLATFTGVDEGFWADFFGFTLSWLSSEPEFETGRLGAGFERFLTGMSFLATFSTFLET